MSVIKVKIIYKHVYRIEINNSILGVLFIIFIYIYKQHNLNRINTVHECESHDIRPLQPLTLNTHYY